MMKAVLEFNADADHKNYVAYNKSNNDINSSNTVYLNSSRQEF